MPNARAASPRVKSSLGITAFRRALGSNSILAGPLRPSPCLIWLGALMLILLLLTDALRSATNGDHRLHGERGRIAFLDTGKTILLPGRNRNGDVRPGRDPSSMCFL